MYYTCLIEEKYPHLSKEAFQQLFIQTKGAPESLAHFEKQDWFDWQALEHPETKKPLMKVFVRFTRVFKMGYSRSRERQS